jgi:hypothetical protein
MTEKAKHFSLKALFRVRYGKLIYYFRNTHSFLQQTELTSSHSIFQLSPFINSVTGGKTFSAPESRQYTTLLFIGPIAKCHVSVNPIQSSFMVYFSSD